MSPASASRRWVVLGTAAAAVLLLVAAPSPAACVTTLSAAGGAADQVTPLVALLSLVAWSLAAWLLLVLAVTAGGHLPGTAGGALAVLARRLAPATVRRTVEVALGLTVAVGVLGAAPAGAAPGPVGPAVAADLDWAEAAVPAAPRAPGLDWGSTALAAQVADPDPAPTAAAAPAVVVQPGDSLWALAEQDLAARGQSTADAAVAQAWPTWWTANRDVVGDDPDLLQPGVRLSPPQNGSTPPASS